jgi:hypothetical protein
MSMKVLSESEREHQNVSQKYIREQAASFSLRAAPKSAIPEIKSPKRMPRKFRPVAPILRDCRRNASRNRHQ